MRALRLVILLWLSTVFAMAAEIQSYSVRLQATDDHAGEAMVAVALTGCAPGTLALPLAFSAPENLRLVEAPPGVRLELGPRNGMTLLRFHFPEGMPSQATLRFSFSLSQVFLETRLAPGEKSTLPAGSRIFRHAFVNTQESPIGIYRLEFLFPEGLRAQAIREQLPRPKKSEVGPRVLLTKLEHRQAAILQFAGLHQGDDTSMALELVPSQRSLGWLIVGLLLGGLYLVKFKDLVAKKSI